MIRRFIFFLLTIVSLASMSCQMVKPYQRIYLNDYEMRTGFPGARNFEQYVQAYREGAIGGGGTKSSGGCGCN